MSSDFKYYLHVNAQQPGEVSNGLNERQFEISIEFPLKDSFKLFDGLSCFLTAKDGFVFLQ